MSQDKITFKCAKCGRKDFNIPNNPKPNDMVTCRGCGATSRYADVQAATMKLGKEAVEKALRDGFKKAGFK
jgi:RNase P subunit RPR2